ncbi:hypothetical protein DRE_06631 [Drechslerella stenobrocha 248]|uniref:Uncharacterized protein n=1 Tax=Drechslerella stenobrocha 248 TaxID=1043628 RepID=W7HX14_9PEZI|nr:hypothetical protein DRE_06631 [Drechslerella stenobrocha 248]
MKVFGVALPAILLTPIVSATVIQRYAQPKNYGGAAEKAPRYKKRQDDVIGYPAAVNVTTPTTSAYIAPAAPYPTTAPYAAPPYATPICGVITSTVYDESAYANVTITTSIPCGPAVYPTGTAYPTAPYPTAPYPTAPAYITAPIVSQYVSWVTETPTVYVTKTCQACAPITITETIPCPPHSATIIHYVTKSCDACAPHTASSILPTTLPYYPLPSLNATQSYHSYEVTSASVHYSTFTVVTSLCSVCQQTTLTSTVAYSTSHSVYSTYGPAPPPPSSAGVPSYPSSAGVPGHPSSAGVPSNPSNTGAPHPSSAGVPSYPSSAGVPAHPSSSGTPTNPTAPPLYTGASSKMQYNLGALVGALVMTLMHMLL